MSPVAEMFKYMALGFGGIGLLALLVILWGRNLQRDSEIAETPGRTCPCGEKNWCLLASYLGVCNAHGRTRFIRQGKMAPRPSAWWVFAWSLNIVLFLLFVIGAITGWGPIHGFSTNLAYPVAVCTLLGTYVRNFFRPRPRP